MESHHALNHFDSVGHDVFETCSVLSLTCCACPSEQPAQLVNLGVTPVAIRAHCAQELDNLSVDLESWCPGSLRLLNCIFDSTTTIELLNELDLWKFVVRAGGGIEYLVRCFNKENLDLLGPKTFEGEEQGLGKLDSFFTDLSFISVEIDQVDDYVDGFQSRRAVFQETHDQSMGLIIEDVARILAYQSIYLWGLSSMTMNDKVGQFNDERADVSERIQRHRRLPEGKLNVLELWRYGGLCSRLVLS